MKSKTIKITLITLLLFSIFNLSSFNYALAQNNSIKLTSISHKLHSADQQYMTLNFTLSSPYEKNTYTATLQHIDTGEIVYTKTNSVLGGYLINPTFEYDKLINGEKYLFNVSTEDYDNPGQPITFSYTETFYNDVPQPTIINDEIVNDTNFHVQWDIGSQNINKYTFNVSLYKNQGRGYVLYQNKSVDGNQTTFSNLVDGRYYVEVETKMKGNLIEEYNKFSRSSTLNVLQPITDISILGGNINLNFSPFMFNSTTLNHDVSTKSNASTILTLSDNRGSGSGWSVNLAITDFVSPSISDPSSNGNGDFTVKFPASSVAYTTSNPTLISGQNIDSTYGPLSISGILNNIPQNLVNASVGFGMGIYNIPLDFEITIPKTVEINSLNGAGSKYVVGNEVGTIATTYLSTFTFTQTIGI